MLNVNNVPPALQEQAKLINSQIKEDQKKCPHNFQKIMGLNPNYSPRVDGRGIGATVIKELHCQLCNLHKPFNEIPWKVCHYCAGEMKLNHTELFDGDRVSIHKCVSCGHEYDTT